jgi:hypothetical protein
MRSVEYSGQLRADKHLIWLDPVRNIPPKREASGFALAALRQCRITLTPHRER